MCTASVGKGVRPPALCSDHPHIAWSAHSADLSCLQSETLTWIVLVCPQAKSHSCSSHATCYQHYRHGQSALFLAWLTSDAHEQSCQTRIISQACPFRRFGGEEAAQQWAALEKRMQPLQQGAALFPAAALRNDAGALRRVALNEGATHLVQIMVEFKP